MSEKEQESNSNNIDGYKSYKSKLGGISPMSEKENEKIEEEIEQVDELSKATLGSYIKKASDPARGDWQPNSWKAIDRLKRGKGIAKAVDKLTKEEVENESMQESTASETLHANSRPVTGDHKSKVETMSAVVGAMSNMSRDELTKWFDQAVALIGKEADSLPANATSDHNQSSVDATTGSGPKTRDVMPKLSVKEDVDEMFRDQELSDEFKERASVLFDAAISARSHIETARIEEEYETRLEEEVQYIGEEIEKNLDTYLNYVVEKWLEDNEVAIESALRNEISEDFIGGLKNLFATHNIDMPEEKVSVVEELIAKVEELEALLNTAIGENSELKSVVLEAEKEATLEEMAEDLTMSQAEKFAALAEGIDFTGDLEAYKKKLAIVKENYFQKKTATSTNIEEETFEGETNSTSNAPIDPEVNRYVQAISRTIKK